MLALPPQALHIPFHDGPYRMAMDLVTVSETAWFEIDTRYIEELPLKRRLLTEHGVDVFSAQPGSDEARAECLALISENLVRNYPTWFHREGARLDNHLTGESWNLDAPRRDPLQVAGLLVQEDLCLIQQADDDVILSAAMLCFPSRWRLSEKIGKRLPDVHHAVPLYAERLARPVDRFMLHVKPGHIACRLNWSVLDDPALFQPGGKWRRDGGAHITADNAGHHVFLRVERQTFRRLPTSNAVLFGIRVHVYPLHQLAGYALSLAAAIRALPDPVLHYKSMLPIRESILEWLDRRSEGCTATPWSR